MPDTPPKDIGDCHELLRWIIPHRDESYAQRFPYVFKLDIRRYFPSIDHRLLKGLLRRRIKDSPVLRLLDAIIDGSPEPSESGFAFPGDDLFTPLERPRGIPIGNLTSQLKEKE